MTKEQMQYCRGCDYVCSSGSEPTCDYMVQTGKTRGCPAGEGCPYHTKLCKEAAEEARLAEVRKMFNANATVKEIAGHMGWTVSKAQNYCRKHDMVRKPGWNMKRSGKEPSSRKKPKPKEPKEPKESESAEPLVVNCNNITLGQFLDAIKALLPDKLNGAALYIDGQQVKELYGYSVTMPEGKLTVDLLTMR